VNTIHHRFGLFSLVFLFAAWLTVSSEAQIREYKTYQTDDSSEMAAAAIAPTLKFKRISGPDRFGGNMTIWGLRALTGKIGRTKLGIAASAGILNGNSLRCDLKMGGLSVEDFLLTDRNLTWRLTIGGGEYTLKTIVDNFHLNKGAFTYAEPMLFGSIRMAKHFQLMLGAGYLLTNTRGVRIEGPCFQAELLIGLY
jgi:hypothetical protein